MRFQIRTETNQGRQRFLLQLFPLLGVGGLLVFLSSCGGGGGTAPGGGGQPSVPAVSLLAGDPAAPAVSGLPDVSAPPAAPQEIEGELLLSRISLMLRHDARIADVNAAAQAAGATGIAFSRPNSPFLTLTVPRQPDAAALDRLAGGLRSLPGILLASPGRQMAAHQLPTVADPPQTQELDHLLATRFPAAWNARRLAEAGCGSRKVTVIVPDLYGGGSSSIFDGQVPGASANFDSVRVGTSDGAHGYAVASILAGKFDGTAPAGANPFPDCLKIVPVDLSGIDFFQSVGAIRFAITEAIREAIDGESGKIIVNGSIGYKSESITAFCGPDGQTPCTVNDIDETRAPAIKEHIALRAAQGIAWAEFAMQPDFVDNTLIAAAAGNDRNRLLGELYPGFRSAHFATPFAVAAQLSNLSGVLTDPALWTSADPGLPGLLLDPAVIDGLRLDVQAFVLNPVTNRNLTLVGSTTNKPLVIELQPSPFSDEGADLNAVGEAVTGLDLRLLDGTSFSAPQVAGLASYLWLLDDDLRTRPVAETLQLIRATSQSNGSVGGVIDAYAAVLALDSRRQAVRIRKALLDVDGNGVFDDFDLRAFAQAYRLNDPTRPSTPATADYSRFDLNGDGFTGGIAIAPFDLDVNGLDANGAPKINSVTTMIEGYEITMNEAALSDLQILCYYAYAEGPGGAPLIYSPAAGAVERTQALGPENCVGARLAVNLPPQVSSPENLDVLVKVPSGNGQFGPGVNLLIGFTPTCATVTSAGNRTDGNGAITVTVTPQPGCSSLSVDVVARANPGTVSLAQSRATAAVGIQTDRWTASGLSYFAFDPDRGGTVQVGVTLLLDLTQTGEVFSGNWSIADDPGREKHIGMGGTIKITTGSNLIQSCAGCTGPSTLAHPILSVEMKGNLCPSEENGDFVVGTGQISETSGFVAGYLEQDLTFMRFTGRVSGRHCHSDDPLSPHDFFAPNNSMELRKN